MASCWAPAKQIGQVCQQVLAPGSARLTIPDSKPSPAAESSAFALQPGPHRSHGCFPPGSSAGPRRSNGNLQGQPQSIGGARGMIPRGIPVPNHPRPATADTVHLHPRAIDHSCAGSLFGLALILATDAGWRLSVWDRHRSWSSPHSAESALRR